ncbi:alpha-2,8-polysialyltransferase family protein [Actinocorallia aurea]
MSGAYPPGPVRGRVLLCAAATRLGAAAFAAALDLGLLPAAPRRILLASVPPGPAVAARFTDVLDWDAEFAPLRPLGWTPRPQDLPVLERWLTQRWSLAGPIRLVVDAPAALATLGAVLTAARITVCAAGLDSYGPTEVRPPDGVGSRITRLLHLDLVPGLSPLLLREYGLVSTPVPAAPLQTLLGPPDAPAPAAKGALLLPEDLAARGVLPAEAEQVMLASAVRAVAARGITSLRCAGETVPGAVLREARRLGLAVGTVADPWSARPVLAVGHASATLTALARIGGATVAAVGTRRLVPTSERVAATLTHLTVPLLTRGGRLVPPARPPLQPLLDALSYTLRPGQLPELRPAAVAHLTGADAAHGYFPASGLAALGLPAPGTAQRLRRVLHLGALPRHARPLGDQPCP